MSETLDPLTIGTRDQMRANGRVPTRLTVIVELPETPMGNEAAATVTHHLLFEDARLDPGKLGDIVRALTAVRADG